jgi:CheY-like chemotaxis protein
MDKTIKTRLLVVDDDLRLRELLNRYLTEQGFQVQVAADGAAMDKQLARNVIDLVVLDLMLPGEDGLSICRRLRAAAPTLPIVMLTAKTDIAISSDPNFRFYFVPDKAGELKAEITDNLGNRFSAAQAVSP